MKEYYAKSKNAYGDAVSVERHLRLVGELCEDFLDPIGYGDWGFLMGTLHDFGKISDSFQDVLSGRREGVNHALPGAAVAVELRNRYIADVIASHHSELGNNLDFIEKTLRGKGDRYDSKGREISLFGQQELRNALLLWAKQFKPGKVKSAPSFSDSEDEALSRMLFIRMLYSALIDADWSVSAQDSEADYLETHTGSALDSEAALEQLLKIRKQKQVKSTADPYLNQLRDKLFDACLEAGKQHSGLFTLTAPTGLGKTLSLLAFSLQHCISSRKRRVILLLPYLSIIEQNCEDYRQIMPELLEIHSHVAQSEANVRLSERWDAPCIVTTNVSFLEPLFSARAGSCRHLHHFAQSVIVLDEAQTLPPELLDATLRTLKELCDHYGCTVLLSTATQPAFQFRPGLKWSPREIVPDQALYFSTTRRVDWQWRLAEPVSLEKIAEEAAVQKQCCIIVNMRKHARRLHGILSEMSDKDALFYMTTDLCPAHRTEILSAVKKRLKDGLPCRLVATQCVEAGVDLDFPVIYRSLAPLDSLIQAAGRCNRNGKPERGKFIVFIPDEEGALYPSPSYELGAQCVQYMPEHPDYPCEGSYINEYYRRLYGNCAGDKAELRAAIKEMNYSDTEEAYRLIPDSGAEVIVPYRGRIELYRQIRDIIDSDGLSKSLLKLAGEITVSTYDRDKAKQYYIPLVSRARRGESAVSTGYFILGNEAFYNNETGLNFDTAFDGIL